ncbi:MAG TPA: CHAT domain-containing protein, partial [Caldilineaceae bacterium]|nr:CHAT domain-containing protein [Caldilineaceae bacterium]
PPPPPDLTLSIVYDRLRKTLQFKLHAESPEVGYRDRSMGEVALTADPSEVMAELFLNLSTMAATPVDSASAEEQAVQLAELETIGEDLFARLFPPALQQEYWRIKRLREQGLVRTLLIISDEPWIPWELVKPFQFDQASGAAHQDGFLAEEFHLARWLARRGVAPVTEIRAARLVAPRSNLAYTEKERSFFAELAQQGIEVGEPLGTRSKVLETFGAARVKLVHVAAHGAFQMQSPNNAPLELDNNEYLRPADLAGSRALAARRERPLVFLNACQVGQLAFYLTGLGGWAERMVADIGVSAFVGALWEINDQLAAEFAIFFYRQLIAGTSLAAAFHAARLHLREQAPGNPTWLAYTLYADPNARVTWLSSSSR